MSKREKQFGWVIIVGAAVFIAGYLLRYGETAYGGRQATPVVFPPSVAAPKPTPLPPPEPVGPTAEETPAPTPVPGAPPARTAKPTLGPVIVAPAPVSVQPSREPPPPPPPSGPTPEDAPRIRFAQAEFDFGSLYQDESVAHEYLFENVGRSPLRIQGVNTSCGCTAAKPPEGEIAPGEQGAIKITFSSGRMRDRVTKHVYVSSNDPAEPRATLTVTGLIKVEVDVVPTGIYFGALPVGQTVERSVLVKPVETERFKILEVKSSDPAIAVSKPLPAGKSEPEGSYRVTITVGPLAEPKRISGTVRLRTDLAHQKEITISVYGRVVAEEVPGGPAPKP